MYTLEPSHQDDNQTYKLYRPISWYRTKGRALGFRFLPGDFDRATANGGRLGERRYLPSEKASTSLPFPLGSMVECYLSVKETADEVQPQPAYGQI